MSPPPSSPQFYAGCPSCRNPPNLSWLGTGTKYAGLHTRRLTSEKMTVNQATQTGRVNAIQGQLQVVNCIQAQKLWKWDKHATYASLGLWHPLSLTYFSMFSASSDTSEHREASSESIETTRRNRYSTKLDSFSFSSAHLLFLVTPG